MNGLASSKSKTFNGHTNTVENYKIYQTPSVGYIVPTMFRQKCSADDYQSNVQPSQVIVVDTSQNQKG
jgi:hypothetical protein